HVVPEITEKRNCIFMWFGVFAIYCVRRFARFLPLPIQRKFDVIALSTDKFQHKGRYAGRRPGIDLSC
ncbi:MAG: hypothetical protein KC496_00090, partial [Anaerolineae bacterium]|nr:hypothetical protein [Anaerolineae bacterium]